MVIAQGDVVWVDLPPPRGSEPAGRRPAVVLQHDRLNRSQINTTVVVAVTSNLKYAALPGNVRLRKGEAGLPRPSVVNVTQIATIDRGAVLAKAGTLSAQRLAEVWEGVRLVIEPRPAAP
ncbi:MAG TPA: type II toxin-antitoxin system PemK/MazF family toxin [Planctomycetota bacterium]|nr:type II toxin-antitoxin system PemK/MazF family toxin [Planctomycetota bacterium]